MSKDPDMRCSHTSTVGSSAEATSMSALRTMGYSIFLTIQGDER